MSENHYQTNNAMKRFLFFFCLIAAMQLSVFGQYELGTEQYFYKGNMLIQTALLTSDGHIAILFNKKKLILIDKQANVLWQKDIDAGQNTKFYSMSLIDGNKFLVAGSLNRTPYLAFLDADGTMTDLVGIDNETDSKLLAAIKLDNSDYLVLKMIFSTEWSKYYPVKLIRLNSSFEEIWSVSVVSVYEPPSNRYKLEQKPNGSLAVLCNWDPLTVPFFGVYTADGQKLFGYEWKSTSHKIATDMALDEYGNVFVTGYSTSIARACYFALNNSCNLFSYQDYFDAGTTASYGIAVADSNIIVETGSHLDEMFVRFIDQKAELLKLFHFNSLPNQCGNAILSDMEKVYVIGGQKSSGLSINNHLITIALDTLLTSANDPALQDLILVKPNPFSDYLHLETAQLTDEYLMDYAVYNLQGLKVCSGKIVSQSGSAVLNLAFLNSGVYIFAIRSEANRWIYNKIVKL